MIRTAEDAKYAEIRHHSLASELFKFLRFLLDKVQAIVQALSATLCRTFPYATPTKNSALLCAGACPACPDRIGTPLRFLHPSIQKILCGPESIPTNSGRPLRLTILLLATLAFHQTTQAQDTIFLYGDTIRIGSLEWDMQKDWRAKGTRITENRQLYGDHVRILLSYHRNQNAAEITFGYIDKNQGFIKHGPARYYYESGQMLSKRTFVEGHMQGLAEDYFRDGKLKARTTMRDDRLQGAYASFFPDGTHESACVYVRDSLDGTLRSWYSNGQPKRIEHWAMDAKVGVDTSFYEDGKLESTTAFIADQESGPMRIYHRNGRQWTEWIYEKGRLIEVAFTQSKEGNPLEVGTFSQGDGWVNLYNDNGLLTERLKFKDGFLRKRKKAKE
jgi:antitoxin component YwqK of YwqJK toxin-antitoxin module